MGAGVTTTSATAPRRLRGWLSTSFTTAAALLALHAAAQAGLKVERAAVQAALACLERQRLPDGSYAYGSYTELRPAALYNRRQGSLGRAQPCNLALWRWGRLEEPAALQQGVAALWTYHHFLRIGYGRPYPHEAWYFTAGYYVLFGHRYAAEVVRELPPALRGQLPAQLAGWLVEAQHPEGYWFDFPLYGYHEACGTALALLALQQLLGC
ncbi:MAG: hypothetical protein KatS3mg102_2706 [Planctomycetota bacterium]|nr:MAG: hypothetical protein KatS3mg102_2706 [Planctomycetota bacterium]